MNIQKSPEKDTQQRLGGLDLEDWSGSFDLEVLTWMIGPAGLHLEDWLEGFDLDRLARRI